MIALSWGHWAGVYVIRGYCVRLCLGWVAITYVPVELEELIGGYLAACEAAVQERELAVFRRALDDISRRR